PMNGVLGLTGLLLGTDLDPRQRQYAEGVQSAAEALLAVINDILDFSKIEAGRLDLEVVDLDLREVVEESADLLAQPARRKGLELVAYCGPDVPTALRGDPGRLRQVLINLVSNAVKFTERGEVVVRAVPEGAPSESGAVAIRFEVADTGIGIDPAQAQRLFEPFAQADASTTRRYGGTGLGLAISSQLVRAMGGELHVDARPGEGSRFWFVLHLEPQAQAASPSAPRPTHRLHGLRVLIVDDNETNRLILYEQLLSWGLRPDAVADGTAALAALDAAVRRGTPYELALLDMCMEPMDGLDLARRITAEARLGACRLILLSSSADELDAASAADAGIAARLTKPVRQSQLYDTLVRTMSEAPEVAAPRRRSPPPPAAARGHLLVVEDNLTNQMVALGILEELQFSADVAGNGLEALQALEEKSYGAVLMDCQMPEMDGYQATAEIRRREGESRHTPIIAMTAGAMEGDRERCLAAGMDDYVPKPVDPAALEAALLRWVSAGEPTRAVLDQHRLGLLRGMGKGDGSLLTAMADAFRAELPPIIDHLRAAAGRGDADALAQQAHRLRGAAANLGATHLAELCEEMEGRAGAGDVDGAPTAVETLAAAAAAAVDALAREVRPTEVGGRSA
ncbi:MAG: response regulator, partial [Actinobacteria bacterium]|nr:response regulator [Actinomycetota bacterium]